MMKNPNPAKICKTTKSTCGGAETIVGSIGDLLTKIFVHLPLKTLSRFKKKTPNPAKISEKTCGGAERVGMIGDLLIEIFLHLPLKPLIRFKTVSKQWNSIISEFMRCQQVHNNNRAIGLILQKIYLWKNPTPVETGVVSFDSSINPLPQLVLPDRTLRIFHSCNGLLVLKSLAAGEKYYVYNPTTNQITAPLLKDDVINARPRDFVRGMYLAFDPTKSPHYKVVCVWMLTFDQYQFEVYSSETGSWEIHGGENAYIGYVDFENHGVYWNGAIHWFSLLGKSLYFNPDHNEMPRVVPAAPPHPHNNWRLYFFGESCDHLHFAVYNLAREINVYEMRRDYSEWFLTYRVDYSSHNYLRTVSTLYSVVRGNKDEDSFLVFGTDEGEMIRYNLVHNTCETILDKAFDFKMIDGFGTYQYIESPCSV